MADTQRMPGSDLFALDKKKPMRSRKREALSFICPPYSPEFGVVPDIKPADCVDIPACRGRR